MPHPIHITEIRAHPMNVPLLAPFAVAGTPLDVVENVAIAVALSDGTVGWGEASTLPPITVEDQELALSAVHHAEDWLVGNSVKDWELLAGRLAEQLPGQASSRAGLEMAMVDALARSRGIPLFKFFGGKKSRVMTDITIPICEPDIAETLACSYHHRGFQHIKTKVGKDVGEDIKRLQAIHRGHPDCVLILDANEGYSEDEALLVLDELRATGIEPGLFEQPVARENWEGLGKVTREAGILVAADESCRTVTDAHRIVHEKLAHVINIKLAKCGLAESLAIISLARKHGVGLMIGGMVETRLAMGFSAHLAAGQGGFEWVDLDTQFLLSEDPIQGGYVAEGPYYDLRGVEAGHGSESPRAFQARPTAGQHQGIMLPRDIHLIDPSTICQAVAMCFS